MFKTKWLWLTLLIPLQMAAQNEPFVRRTVISGLNSPWEITYGPNDSIWVTENSSYRVRRVNISNGASTILISLSAARNFSPNDGGRWPQGGLMGMALHPNLYSPSAEVRAQKPWVYLAYVYERITGQTCSSNPGSSNACYFRTRIVRYDYIGDVLTNPQIILDNMPGSNDHNSGRMTIGPDLKLYYTIGDMGAGQFNNSSRTNNAQALDIMEGKVLRLNTEPDSDSGTDAWVPNDNPFYNGTPVTPRDYVYTLGHRNAQGIVWGQVDGNDILFSSEHGDRTDDELNLLIAGHNYGWNRVSGYCDGNYNGLTLGGFSPVNEDGFCSGTSTNEPPLKTLFTLDKPAITGLSGDFLTWPTVAPSSIDFYGNGLIPNWQNSILVTCLKAGRVYRLKLNPTDTSLLSYNGGMDTSSLFRGQGRYRDIAISPNGLKIYLACDASGQTSGPTGGFNGGGSPPPNAGSILEFSYVGIILPIQSIPGHMPTVKPDYVKLFPNPTNGTFTVSIKGSTKPYSIEVYNASGVLLREKRSTKPETTVDLADLKAGIFFVQVKNAYGQLLKTEKMVKM